MRKYLYIKEFPLINGKAMTKLKYDFAIPNDNGSRQ